MLGDSHSLTIGAESVTVNKVNQDNFSSVYYGRMASGDTVNLTVSHTLPKKGSGGESHLVKLAIEHFTEGVYARTSTAWTVIKTFDGTQDDGDALDAVKALQSFLESGAEAFDTATAVLGRQS